MAEEIFIYIDTYQKPIPSHDLKQCECILENEKVVSDIDADNVWPS
ncbi:hypothetical protein [Candidatus Berkiella aquae]|uniref:Uncharacterized protein n=1 Tax=Candidatus Berkiella aquae TaxID=295108 RepID=A0A0Q9YT50_9GAMM|nr:hypothetical protein [Candidatus Berkiella aquae]MCS5710822.1 hypothetical protein [Candidatus Berkiella aquae]